MVLHAEVFGPITLVKLKLMLMSLFSPAHDPKEVCFIGSHPYKKLGLKYVTYITKTLFGSIHYFVYLVYFVCSKPISMMEALQHKFLTSPDLALSRLLLSQWRDKEGLCLGLRRRRLDVIYVLGRFYIDHLLSSVECRLGKGLGGDNAIN